MKKIEKRLLHCALGLMLLLPVACAPTHMAAKGKLLFQDDFATPATYTAKPQAVAEGWTVQIAHSNWKQTGDGVQSVWKGGHMPVLQFDCDHPLGDIVVEVEFRFHKDSTSTATNQGAACRISPTNPKLDPAGYAASIWANLDSMDRKPGLVLEHDEWKKDGIVTVDLQPLKLEPDTWYPVTMELIGNTVMATANGVSVYGSHEMFGLPKTTIALGSGYCVHDFRHLRVYAATPNPKWVLPAAPKAAADAKPQTPAVPKQP
jgi:hypothetical protein